MANQPPPTAGPFFRLARPTQSPRPPIVRPPFTISPIRPPPPQDPIIPPPPPAPVPVPVVSIPTSSIPRTFAPSSSMPTSPPSTLMPPITSSFSVPSGPIPKVSASSVVQLSTSSGISKALPTLQTPEKPQSPKIKPPTPPPSSITLPPSQLKSILEPEPKSPLHVEPKTIEEIRPKGSLNGDSLNYVKGTCKPKDVDTKEKGIHKKLLDSEGVGTRMITLSGDNKGAFMEIGYSQKKHHIERSVHGHVYEKKDNSVSSKDEGKWQMRDKSSHQKLAAAFPPMRAFINSNVQGVNNSILHSCSCTHHDPGVHLSLSRKPT